MPVSVGKGQWVNDLLNMHVVEIVCSFRTAEFNDLPKPVV